MPLGTLEWHQEHLPLGLDAFVSHELCKKACEYTGGVVIPSLFFGTDREHQTENGILHGMDSKAGRVLEGSVYFIKQGLFKDFLQSILESIALQGFRKAIIVSAHSGTAQQGVLEQIQKLTINNLEIIILPGKKFVGGIDHAGRIETSLMLYLNQGLVDMDLLTEPYEEGTLSGDNPKLASKEEGEKRFNQIVEQIVAMVSDTATL